MCPGLEFQKFPEAFVTLISASRKWTVGQSSRGLTLGHCQEMSEPMAPKCTICVISALRDLVLENL